MKLNNSLSKIVRRPEWGAEKVEQICREFKDLVPIRSHKQSYGNRRNMRMR